jgi:hypothetical protein
VNGQLERPRLTCALVADFCAGGTDNTPESTITQILVLQGYDQNDMFFRVIHFYIEVSSPCRL